MVEANPDSLPRMAHTDSLLCGFDLIREHYSDFIMSSMASQITIQTIVYSITVYLGADQIKQRSASLAFCAGNSPGPVNSQRASNAENVSI